MDCACKCASKPIVRHKLLLTCCHVFHLHLRPLVPEQKRDARTQIFGGLELPGDFRWRERVIDAVAAVAQLLDLCERVGTAFFFCNNYVDVDLAARSLLLSASLRARRGISLINSPRTTSPMAKPSAGSESAPSLSCAIKLS